jgi:NADPH2:quinone reductase
LAEAIAADIIFTADPRNLRSMSERVFDAVRTGVIRPLIGARYPRAGAADAHRALESRTTTASSIPIS